MIDNKYPIINQILSVNVVATVNCKGSQYLNMRMVNEKFYNIPTSRVGITVM